MDRAMAALFRKNFSRCDVVYSPWQLCEDMKREHGIIITYKQGLTGCKLGIEAVRGSPDESYQHLVSYSYMLVKHSPGTKTTIETDTKGGFLYYFFALGVSLHGFKTCCRPAFAVDGTYLSGERKGTLLLTIGYDANEKMYPIAFGIVDSENGDSCLRFMQKLFDALGREYSMNEDLVVCSDRLKSFESAIAEKTPDNPFSGLHTVTADGMVLWP
ncbi:hypothetical protein MKW98_021263 [Papaver atlanticum]|uniref:MULE transposase domain-containing protein n=1 Tax=Papaver atlanticum TaxID=357466 RepID=A0AAD4T6C3_9MAGN|nr:hypothetical protein MKW98_021263 [Papaver atlanticum]